MSLLATVKQHVDKARLALERAKLSKNKDQIEGAIAHLDSLEKELKSLMKDYNR